MRRSIVVATGWLLFMAANAAGADLYIIANKELPINEIGKNDIAAIYLLKQKQWQNGEPIVPINLPAQTSARAVFTDKIFDSSPEKLGSYWDKMLFQGINPPITQNSEQAVILFVERLKGAIGYVEAEPNNPQVKVIHKLAGSK